MSIALSIPAKHPFKWYEVAAYPPKTVGGSVLAVIPEWDNVIVVAHKEQGVWWMNNGLNKRKQIPTPSVWANIPPAPHEVENPRSMRMIR